MVRAEDIVDGDIESAEGIGPPPPPGLDPGLQPLQKQGEPGNQSPFTPDEPVPKIQPKPPENRPIINLSSVRLTEDDVREAFASYVSNQKGRFFKKKDVVKESVILDIKPIHAARYRLETFTEWRGTGWVSVPYRDGEVDGPENGTPPSGWDIEIYPDEPFTNHVKTAEMPHTASVAMCAKCGGSGTERCRHCGGMGSTNCGTCNGRGLVYNTVRRGDQTVHEEKKCGSCDNGRKRCPWCFGNGTTTCSNCRGSGQMKRYLQLYVKFKNGVKEFVHNDPTFPSQLIEGMEGDVLFEETGMDVKPVRDFPQPEINTASRSLIAQYNRERYHTDTNSERQLGQRHSIRGVPVTDVRYRYQDVPRHFWVYGRERLVYSPDYPGGGGGVPGTESSNQSSTTCCSVCNVM